MDEQSESTGGRIPVSRIQQIIGEKMVRSRQEIPSFSVRRRADLGRLMEVRAKLGRAVGTRLTTNDFFIRATALAVEQYPRIAGRLNGDMIEIPEAVNVGFAVAAPQGLVVPVIKRANEKSLGQIAAETARLLKKARSDSLGPEELAEPCITVSNLGVYGIDSFTAIVTPGQCSVLAVGKITDGCVARGGDLEVARMMTLDLSVDHRIVNGVYAGQVLGCIVEHLERPEELAD